VDRDRVVRRALWTSVPFNLGGALTFAFPESLGRLAGFPTPVAPVYSATLAMLVTLFAVTYAWLAHSPAIDRPLVAFSALGKAAFFVVVVACWLAGEAAGRAVLAASGELVFAGIFTWWLVTTSPAALLGPTSTSR